MNCVCFSDGDEGHENKYQLNSFTAIKATEGGHLECLAYALEHGCTPSCLAVYVAIKYKRLNCLRYLHKYGCEWRKAASVAIEYSSWDCLVYAIENGCSHDRNKIPPNIYSRLVARKVVRLFSWMVAVLRQQGRTRRLGILSLPVRI